MSLNIFKLPIGTCQCEYKQITLIVNNLFEGLLKVSVVTNDTTNSKFYPLHADLDKTASQEKEGPITEILQGSIKFGRNAFSPDFEYKLQDYKATENLVKEKEKIIRILMVSVEYPPINGGIGHYTYNLTKNLMKLGCEVYIAFMF